MVSVFRPMPSGCCTDRSGSDAFQHVQASLFPLWICITPVPRQHGKGRLSPLQKSKSAAHALDLRSLCRDDHFGDLSNLRITSVAKDKTRHFDRSGMVRDHHREKIDVSPSRSVHAVHIAHHAIHGLIHVDREWRDRRWRMSARQCVRRVVGGMVLGLGCSLTREHSEHKIQNDPSVDTHGVAHAVTLRLPGRT